MKQKIRHSDAHRSVDIVAVTDPGSKESHENELKLHEYIRQQEEQEIRLNSIISVYNNIVETQGKIRVYREEYLPGLQKELDALENEMSKLIKGD